MLGSRAARDGGARGLCCERDEKMKVGKSTMLDYNNVKTKMEKSESDMVQAKYEVIFNCKILDFYTQGNLTID